jgi:hypothetical protein
MVERGSPGGERAGGEFVSDFDDNLRAHTSETELFFSSIVHEDAAF